ncbi:MAG: type IV toxin-antitoxin system AbiEi family antitoxin domain-containing protein [Bacteroidales bacterium]|nr:type IV toxin-antitoxin system AbiEi family antitoxin domain-containing protein [Bacteroidales bacterium]
MFLIDLLNDLQVLLALAFKLVVVSCAANSMNSTLLLDADLAFRGNQSFAGISIPNRLAWCFLRVAMVLSALRLMDSGRITENVECNDVDFDTTMKIIKVITTHNDYIFNVLDKERPEGIAVADSYSSATRKAIISALPGYFTTEDMKKVAANVGKSLRTVRRQIARAIEAGEIQQVKHGEYKKM